MLKVKIEEEFSFSAEQIRAMVVKAQSGKTTGKNVLKVGKPGVVDMKVMAKKPVGFYVRTAKSLLVGGVGRDGVRREPTCVLNVSGLGESINAAVAAAAAVEAEGLGVIR